MTYGARRNLLGLKAYALCLNIVVVIICVSFILLGPPIQADVQIKDRLIIVLVVAAIHAACVLAFVNERGVFDAARAYGRQLLLSTVPLSDSKKPDAAKSQKTTRKRLPPTQRDR